MTAMLLKLTALCAVGALFCLCLKKDAPPMAQLLSLAVAVTVMAVCLSEMLPFIAFFRELTQGTGFSSYAGVLVKVCGVGMLTRLAADFCRDAGENALAAKAELAGKCAILLCALPVIEMLFQQIKDLLQS